MAPVLNPGSLEGLKQWISYYSHWEIISSSDRTIKAHPCPPSVGQTQLWQSWEELLGSLCSLAPGLSSPYLRVLLAYPSFRILFLCCCQIEIVLHSLGALSHFWKGAILKSDLGRTS